MIYKVDALKCQNEKNRLANKMGGRRGDLEGVIGWVYSKIGLRPFPTLVMLNKMKTGFKCLFRI